MSSVFLDLRTLSFITMLVTIILSVVMSYIWRTGRTYPGFGLWTLSNVSVAIGFCLISLRGIISDFYTIIIGNIFIFLSLILALEGMRSFLGRSNAKIFNISIFAGLIPLLFYFTFADNNVIVRLIFTSILLAVISGKIGYELLTASDKYLKRARSFVIWTYLIFCLLMVFRSVFTYFASNIKDLYTPDWTQSIIFLICLVFAIIWTFGFVMMNNERLQAELNTTQIELKKQAATDFLTGLNNKRRFFEISDNEIHRARRFRHSLTLIMFDIDHFKQVNDNHGHIAGDEVLIEIASICKKTLRNIDVLGRLGGEEFAALLPYTNLENAKIVAEYLRSAIEKTEMKFLTDTIKVTASFGISELNGTDNQIKSMLDRADIALYEAKNNGRNQVIFDATKQNHTELAIV